MPLPATGHKHPKDKCHPVSLKWMVDHPEKESTLKVDHPLLIPDVNREDKEVLSHVVIVIHHSLPTIKGEEYRYHVDPIKKVVHPVPLRHHPRDAFPVLG